jgi:hypothetical protein
MNTNTVPHTEEEFLTRRLNDLGRRIQAIADLEAAQAARGGGPAARGDFHKQKMEMVEQCERIVDRLEELARR